MLIVILADDINFAALASQSLSCDDPVLYGRGRL